MEVEYYWSEESSRELLSNSSSTSVTDYSTTTSEFLVNLAISIPIGVVLVAIYCAIRAWKPSIFEIRRKYSQVVELDEDANGVDLSQSRQSVVDDSTFHIGHPHLSEGYLLWLYEVWTMDTSTFFRHAGLDALVFRMYLKGCVWICIAALPYSLFVLLPVYMTGEEHTGDSLKILTVSNCSSESSRLWATVIGAYIMFAIAMSYLSKIYLVVAFAADQNYVGNVGNTASLRQIDNMSWLGYISVVRDVIKLNANVVSAGLSKVKGAVDNLVQATGLIGTDENESMDGAASPMDANEVVVESGSPETKTKSLLPGKKYGSTDDMKGQYEEETSEQELVAVGQLPVQIDKYTVMMRDLPEQFQSEEKLMAFMDRLFPGKVHKIFVVYDVHELTDIYKQIQLHERQLRRLRKKYGDAAVDSNTEPILEGTRCCGCAGEKVDVKALHQRELKALKEQFIDARHRLQPSPSAFVTFKDLQTASVCVTCPIRFGLYPLQVNQAPAPQDLRWANLKFRRIDNVKRNVLVYFLFGLLLIFWAVPVVAIQGLANLESIFKELDINIKDYLSTSTISWLESWLSILILDLFLQLLPDICEFLTKMQRKTSRGREEILIMTKYYDCLVVMVLLVTVLASTVFSSLDNFIGSLSNIFDTLASGLISISTYFMLYILLNAFIWLPLELFRPSYFIKNYLNIKDANRFEYAKWYGKTMLILTICIVYSVMSPLVWIIGLCYFSFCTIVFSYQLSMSYVPAFETGAAVWPAVYQRLTFTFNLGIATLVGLFILKEFYYGAAVIVPLFLINFASSGLSLSFRKVFRSASLTSASEKDGVLTTHGNSLDETWNAKNDIAYYPPVMDIDYNRAPIIGQANADGLGVSAQGSVQGTSYQAET